jgi:hypothetical protein
MPMRGEFLADLRIIERSLHSHHAQALVGPRLAPLMRAVQVFGFHLATLDLRQSSDQHEAVVAELLRVARVEADYSALDEGAAPQPAAGLLNDARPLRVRGAGLQPAGARRTGDLRDRPRSTRRLRARGHPPLHHQPHRRGERPAGSAAAAEGMRPAHRHPG